MRRIKDFTYMREAMRARGDWSAVDKANVAIGAIEECFNEVANISENDNGE